MSLPVAASRESAAILDHEDRRRSHETPLQGWGAFLMMFCASALGAAPDIDSVSPLALRPGVATEITFSGSGLSEATNVWANFPARFEPLGEGRFRVTTPAETPVGIGTVRLHGNNGVSLPAFLMLDDLPTVVETKTNKTRQAAQAVEPGTAVDGRCDELGYDWFKLRAAKGRRVCVEVVASRLGSRLDSVLRALDSSGKEIAHNDDAPGLRGESFLAFTMPDDGDCLIELRDVNYGGGSDYFYRLRVGEFALATTVFPPAVTLGAKQSFRLAGPGGEVGRVPAAGSSTAVPLAVRGANGSTFARALVATTQREVIEREPNDTAAKATLFSLADGINGGFGKPNDSDFYQFLARKGERIEFRAATRSLGSPCDVVLEIVSTNGATLARSNPSAADEGVVTYKFDKSDIHRLVVQEATGAFGPNCVYRITAQRPAGFTLTLDTERINVTPGKSFELKVTCNRGDYKGPVTLSLEGMESLVATNHVIGEGKTNTTMKVAVPDSFAPSEPRFFSVAGTATRDGTEVRARASTLPALRRRFPQMLYPPAELDGVIPLGITQ